MNNSRHERLQDLEKELGIIRSLIDRFWHGNVRTTILLANIECNC